MFRSGSTETDPRNSKRITPLKKILFTKEISEDFLKRSLLKEIDFDMINFLEIKIHPEEKIIPFLDNSVYDYLITSQNSVEAIKNLNLKGNFHAVGKKTAEKLIQNNFKVGVVQNYASELARYILENEAPKNWIFFCGNNRRDELFEKLIPNGHSITEVVCYDSVPACHHLDGKFYDGIAFFSPLGASSYLKNNTLSPETTVFSVGKTTSGEFKTYTKNKTITAEVPTLESVIQSINNYYVKK